VKLSNESPMEPIKTPGRVLAKFGTPVFLAITSQKRPKIFQSLVQHKHL